MDLFAGIDLGYLCSGPILTLGSAVLLSWWAGKRVEPPWIGYVAGFIAGILVGGLIHMGVRYAYIFILYGGEALQPDSGPSLLSAALFSLVMLGLVTDVVLSIMHYARLPNATGWTRDLEHGPEWQFAEYVKRQTKRMQSFHRWIGRLRVANGGVLAGALVVFVLGGILNSLPTVFLAWTLLGLSCVAPFFVLNGLDAIVLGAAIFPENLVVGQREFATGPKASFGGAFRLVAGILFGIGALFLLYFAWSRFLFMLAGF